MRMIVRKDAGFLDKPLKARTVLKAAIILLAALLVVLCLLWVFAFFSMRPPKEKNLIANFDTHRVAYERLRNMLIEDKQVNAVYVDHGVKTMNSPVVLKPSEVNFSVNRYNEYVRLLEEVGSNAAFRSEEQQNDLICIGVWGAGWAGNTRHVWICSTNSTPANQVASLDAYYRNPARPRNVFRHVDGNWYLRADW
jgi:amino acid transporter